MTTPRIGLIADCGWLIACNHYIYRKRHIDARSVFFCYSDPTHYIHNNLTA